MHARGLTVVSVLWRWGSGLACLTLFGPLLYAAQPVGIVIEASSGRMIERLAVGKSPFPAVPGVELFPGDVLKQGKGIVRFAFCPPPDVDDVDPDHSR